METPKLSVEAIEKGTVIDHIPAGKGLIILRQFKLLHYGSAVTVGFNLPSKTQGSKDIIKITGVWLDDNAANRLALFAPEAVVNTIDHFKVINKRRLTLPDENRRSVPLPEHQLRQPRRAGEKSLLRPQTKRADQAQMPLLRKNLQPRFRGRGLVLAIKPDRHKCERSSENLKSVFQTTFLHLGSVVGFTTNDNSKA